MGKIWRYYIWVKSIAFRETFENKEFSSDFDVIYTSSFRRYLIMAILLRRGFMNFMLFSNSLMCFSLSLSRRTNENPWFYLWNFFFWNFKSYEYFLSLTWFLSEVISLENLSFSSSNTATNLTDPSRLKTTVSKIGMLMSWFHCCEIYYRKMTKSGLVSPFLESLDFNRSKSLSYSTSLFPVSFLLWQGEHWQLESRCSFSCMFLVSLEGSGK